MFLGFFIAFVVVIIAMLIFAALGIFADIDDMLAVATSLAVMLFIASLVCGGMTLEVARSQKEDLNKIAIERAKEIPDENTLNDLYAKVYERENEANLAPPWMETYEERFGVPNPIEVANE